MVEERKGKEREVQSPFESAWERYNEGLEEQKKPNPDIPKVLKCFRAALTTPEFASQHGKIVHKRLDEIYKSYSFAPQPGEFSFDQLTPGGPHGVAPGDTPIVGPAFNMSALGSGLPQIEVPQAKSGGVYPEYSGKWNPEYPGQGYLSPYDLAPRGAQMPPYGGAPGSFHPRPQNRGVLPTENRNVGPAYRFLDDTSVYQRLDENRMERLLSFPMPQNAERFLIREFLAGQNVLKEENITNGRGAEEFVHRLLLNSSTRDLLNLVDFFHNSGTSEQSDKRVAARVADHICALAVNSSAIQPSKKAEFMVRRAKIASLDSRIDEIGLFSHAAVQLVRLNDISDFYRGHVYGTIVSIQGAKLPSSYRFIAAEHAEHGAANKIDYRVPRQRYAAHKAIMKDTRISPDRRLQSAVIALTESRYPNERLHANQIIGELWNDQAQIHFDSRIKDAFDQNLHEVKSNLQAPEQLDKVAKAAINCAITPQEIRDAVSAYSGKLTPFHLALAYVSMKSGSEDEKWFNDLCDRQKIDPRQFKNPAYIQQISMASSWTDGFVPPKEQASRTFAPPNAPTGPSKKLDLHSRFGSFQARGPRSGPSSAEQEPTVLPAPQGGPPPSGPDPLRNEPGHGGYGGVQLPLRQQPQRPRPSKLPSFGTAEQPAIEKRRDESSGRELR